MLASMAGERSATVAGLAIVAVAFGVVAILGASILGNRGPGGSASLPTGTSTPFALATSTPEPTATVSPEPTATFGARLHIAVFGDSIAAADWQDLLEAALKARDPTGSYVVVNYAKRATRLDYTEQQVASFPATKYQLAIVIVGRNDYKHVWPDSVKVAAYQKRMAAVVASLEKKGLIVLMANAPPDFVDGAITEGTAKLAQLIRDVAGARLVDLEQLFRDQTDPAPLYSDFEHQTAAGQQLISDAFEQQLIDRQLIP